MNIKEPGFYWVKYYRDMEWEICRVVADSRDGHLFLHTCSQSTITYTDPNRIFQWGHRIFNPDEIENLLYGINL